MKVSAIIKNSRAISPYQGLDAYEFVKSHLSSGKAIEVDFSGIDSLTSAFISAFVGKLYMEFPSDFLSIHLSITGLDNPIWQKKLSSAITLGSNQDVRDNHNSAIESLIDA